jgi:hypothetical protein
MRSTLELARELNCEFANFYSAMAYPGSPLYALAESQNVPLPRAWTGYSQHSRDCLPMPTRYLPAREVLRFRDEAFLSYYRDPHYLQMIDRTFGPETVQHIQAMTGYRVERDLLTGRLQVGDTLLPAGEAPGAAPLQLIQR